MSKERKQKKQAKRDARHLERERRRAQKEAERRNANYPRMSLRSVWYTMGIYRKAVGAKRYFFWLYSAFNSVVPSITALLLGEATNQLLHAVNTQDFKPFIFIAALMLIIQLVNTVLREVNSMLSLTTWQDVYIYVSDNCDICGLDCECAGNHQRPCCAQT